MTVYTRTITNFNRLLTPKPLQKPESFAQIHTIANQVKKCSGVKELECVYATMLKTNASQDCFLINQFISCCTSVFHRTDLAVLAFTQMQEPNVFVYNAVIRGFVHCGCPVQALEVYIHMLRAKVFPTSYTFPSLIKACTSLLGLCIGEAVHGQIWKNGFDSHVFVQTALIDFYSTSNKISDSRRVFDEMPERDAFAWTTMVSAHLQVGDLCSARRLFDEMSERNIPTWNTMIDGYARLGNVEAAELLFNEMPARDRISWTIMITCYSQNKQFREALDMFNKMKKSGISPDGVTMTTIGAIKGLANEIVAISAKWRAEKIKSQMAFRSTSGLRASTHLKFVEQG
ncbi:hypothetical protein Pint_01758 [Pistacia integerrima]|uniref:Uncharacterized protein n=1 Tax=Pistacia integerrima TaxID=434235 RepID=A0ACC0ZLR2_9ROSI|nr:hypothetical protein Pint_01758 [Pistacia integerrima]